MRPTEVVWYRLVRQRMVLAMEVPASDPGRRAWVRVTPMRRKPWVTFVPTIREYFIVGYVELAREVVEMVRESDDYGEYLLNRVHLRVLKNEEVDPELQRLERALSRWRADPRALVQPWACDYPL